VSIESETEIGQAAQTTLQSFQSLFKQKLAKIFEEKVSQSMQAVFLKTIVGSESDLNSTLT